MNAKGYGELNKLQLCFLTLIEEVTMTIQVFGASATVSYLNRAFTDTSPSTAVFSNQVNRITGPNGANGVGEQAFANEFGASFAGLSNAELSKKVLTNMGILPTTDTSVAALESALTDYFAAFGSKVTGTNGQVTADTRGFIVLQLATILSGLENATGNQAVYTAAAAAWNNEVTASYTYSISGNANPSAPGALSSGNTYTLTSGVDTFTGTVGDDTFNAGANNSLNAFDKLDGGAGKDTLTALLSGRTLDSSASIVNVEKVSINTGGLGFTADATAANLSGVTELSVSAGNPGPVLVTAFNTTTVTAAANGSGTKEVVSVTVNAAATATQTMTFDNFTRTVGATADVDATASASAFVAAYNAALGTNWTATSSGAVITLTSKIANTKTDLAATDFTSNGFTTAPTVAITTQGSAGTGTVTVVGSGGVLNITAGAGAAVNVGQTAAANAITAANVTGGGTVMIKDTSGNSAAVGSTLTTVSLTGTEAATLESKGLTTLNLTKQIGDVTVTNATAAHTLTVNTNGTLGSNVTDAIATTLNVVNTGAAGAASFTTVKAATVNLTATGKDLTVNNLVGATGVTKAVNVAGDAKVTITADTLDAAAVITSTNTKGVVVTQALAAGQKFVGAAGADTITVPLAANGGAGASTVANTLGEGDDTVNFTFVATHTLGTGGSIDGGAGNDTLRVSGSAGYSTVPGITGFETLGAGAGASGTFDATGFTGLTEGSLGGAATFSNVAAGVGLSITASTGQTTTVALKDSSGSSDAFTLTVASTASTPVAVAAGTVTTDGVEKLSIVSNGVATGTANTITISDKNLQTLTITGSSDLTLITGTSFGTDTQAAATTAVPGVSSIDASAATGKFVFDDSGDKAVVATAGLTLKGGSADDTITLGTFASKASNTITLGAGKDVLKLEAPNTSSAIFTTVTDAAVGDAINFNSINLNVANVAVAGTKLGAKLVSGVDDYQTFLNAACSKANAAEVSWFQTGGNTYLVVDNVPTTNPVAATNTYTAATDYIVKLVGLVDLSNATINATGGYITLA
jgi:S-layer protein